MRQRRSQEPCIYVNRNAFQLSTQKRFPTQFPADSVTFTEEILNENFNSLCRDNS